MDFLTKNYRLDNKQSRIQKHVIILIESVREKTNKLGSENWAVLSQKMIRSWKFWIKEE